MAQKYRVPEGVQMTDEQIELMEKAVIARANAETCLNQGSIEEARRYESEFFHDLGALTLCRPSVNWEVHIRGRFSGRPYQLIDLTGAT